MKTRDPRREPENRRSYCELTAGGIRNGKEHFSCVAAARSGLRGSWIGARARRSIANACNGRGNVFLLELQSIAVARRGQRCTTRAHYLNCATYKSIIVAREFRNKIRSRGFLPEWKYAAPFYTRTRVFSIRDFTFGKRRREMFYIRDKCRLYSQLDDCHKNRIALQFTRAAPDARRLRLAMLRH